MSDFWKKLWELVERTPEIPDWEPEVRGDCVCGHSWLFHWLRAPHRCNDCKECLGYTPKQRN